MTVSLDQAFTQAMDAHRAGRLAEAEAGYRAVLAGQPRHANSLHLLGMLCMQTGRAPLAAELIARAVAVEPAIPELRLSLGNALQECGNIDAAIACFREAIRLRRDFAAAMVNLGNALTLRGQFDEAMAAFDGALSRQGGLAEAHNGRGVILAKRGDLAQAAEAYTMAVACRNEYPEAHSNLASALLSLGDFERGLPELEWRWKLPSMAPYRASFPQPLWRGQPLQGRTILLYAEQGWGDTIQFIRYAPLVAERGGRVIVRCPAELKSLMASVRGVSEATSDATLRFDMHCPVLSLPLALGTRMETIPSDCPYVKVGPVLSQQWAAKVRPHADGLKVGLVWAGSPAHAGDFQRSIALAQLAPLAKAKATFFSLQKGPAAVQAQHPPTGMKLIDHTADLHDFADTAALIANLDLIISVDTAVVHLAGAMAKNVWVLLSYNADWRWLLDRADSPWYPNLRLFRQKTRGDWAGVMEEVAEELLKIAGRRSGVD